MSTRHLIVDNAPPPAGPYSHAVAANGFLFISGQGPFTESGSMVEGSFRAQAERTFQNLETIAKAAGATLAEAVSVRVFLRQMDDFEEMNACYLEHFGRALPARTTIQSNLPGFEIEVDAVVKLPTP